MNIEALGTASEGNLLFMVDSFAATLHIADITYAFNPWPRATYRLPDGYPWDVDVVNDLVFVNTRGLGVRLFRVDPAQFPSSIYAPLVGKTS